MPLNEQQRLLVGRQLAAVARDRLARDRLQPLAAGCCSRADTRSRVTSCSGAAASASSDGYLSSHSRVLRQHAIDLRLLQHDLGDEDVVRVVGLAPRQIAAVAAVPRQQPLAESAAIGAAAGIGSGAPRARVVGV